MDKFDLKGFGSAILAIYALICLPVFALMFSDVSGYDLRIFPFTLNSLGRINANDVIVVVVSVGLSIVLAAVVAVVSAIVVTWLHFHGRQRWTVVMVLSGFFCSAALRATTLPIIGGQVAEMVAFASPGAASTGYALIISGASVFPLSLAICMLGGGERIGQNLAVFKNLGGRFPGAVKYVGWPMLRRSVMAAFLFGVSLLCFDGYVFRVAGGQTIASVGSLLIDLRSVGDWPMISIICSLTLLLLAPVYAILLPKLTSGGRA